MPEVTAQKTDFGGSRGFTEAVYGAFMRAGLSDAAARILTAHSVLSTNWGKGVHNYNLAGLKASSSWRSARSYAITRGCECRAGLPDTGDPSCVCGPGEGQYYLSAVYWRAYNSLDEAAADFVAALQQSRYSQSYAMLLAGDTEYFAQVGRDGWYTADPAQVKSLALGRLKTVNEYLGEPSGGSGLLTLAIVAAVAWYLLA